MSISENIKKYRKQKNLTQEQLGKLVNLSAISIRKYEGGMTPKLESLNKIANALDVTIYDLIKGKKSCMDDNITGTINLYCYMVQRGKPCASEAIQDRYISEMVKKIKESFHLKTYIEDLAPGWKTLWIYKYDYMLEIIKLLPEEPKTNFEHWILGKAFGYSDEAIKDFLETKLWYK